MINKIFTLIFIMIMFSKQSLSSHILQSYITNKKIIYISPGGYNGFYMLGIASYIKENYDTDDCIFYGASAGAWLSLIMTTNKNHMEIINKMKILNFDNKISNKTNKDLKKIMEINIKKTLLENYNYKDFDLDRLFIKVSQFNGNSLNLKSYIYTGFNDLDDAIDCCIGSSHIPFVTGGLIKTYNNKITFDGALVGLDDINIIKPKLSITPELWNRKQVLARGDTLYQNLKYLYKSTTFFNGNDYNLEMLYEEGYKNAKNNKEYLDNIFEKDNI